MTRREWADLPAHVRGAVEGECGPVAEAEIPSAGRNSDFSATLHLAGGRIFCKGITADSPRARMHRHEAAINRWLPHPLAPRLLWQVETEGWLLLGFEHVAGQHANLSPGSPDLPLVADTVSTLTREMGRVHAGVPSLADQWARLAAWRRLRHDPPEGLHPWSQANLDRLAEWEARALDLVRGDSLLHTDLHGLNILVEDQARVIDWAWSRTGAAWVDVAILVIRLIAEGHTPEGAQDWAETVPAWREASETSRTSGAVAVLGVWEYMQRDDPAPHRRQLTDAARTWARHRLAA